MFGPWFYGFDLWWIFPLVMTGLCVVMCLFFMKRRMGSMNCRPSMFGMGRPLSNTPESALNILDKRYAKGEVSKEEYEEKKRDISRNNYR